MPVLKKIKGRYEIKAVLGEGGMGVVYRAYDPPPMDRDVAVKTLLELPDKTSLQLFYKECEVLKSMSHPNIVEIFDMGEFDDNGHRKPFFVMPLLPGKALDALIRNSSHSLSVERVVDIISQTCRGLQAAHEHGLIHRDLKPSNLFVMQDDSVKIIDFGVAHTVNSNSRSSGFQKGTLLYMAPEQIQYKPVSAQSDIFSLGVVCYEALTRRQPFRGTTEEEIVNAILKHIPPPASEINPAVSQTISRVVHKAMAKQPWNRFDSAREFGDTLRKALRNQPIEIFDPARIQPRIQRANKALESGDYQFASEIVGELEAEGNIDPQLTLLRTQIEQVVRQRTIAQLLESARARFEEEEDPLALQKIQEVLQVDPNNVAAISLKSKIEDRRSERQIEKWLRLARQHVNNHAYAPAREALQNVTQLRPNESRALRLLSDIAADERDYLKQRQQKAQVYQAALNSWKNGEISEALTQMGMVLELDRQAPDSSSPDTSASYQNFYNKVRSEHDAINNGYAEAQRALAEHDFPKALKVCEDFLAKYPNQALFQALKFDVEEQQRQQLSAFIAEVDRKLEAESDLDAKVSLLREALAAYPAEAHFERSLRLVSDKRDLVNSIVLRARSHEERGQISEALSDLEIVRTIYSPYPGLQFEVERLQKRREQQARDSARARWVEQVDRQLETGSYSRALELLQQAQVEFPNDPELIELEKQAQQRLERAGHAEQLLAQGQDLCRQGNSAEGLETLRQARKLDERNPVILTTLRDTLVEQARVSMESDWRVADALAAEALELDPNHALARSIRAQNRDRKREEVVAETASQARRLQAAGDLESAAAEVEKGLVAYPGEPRLTTVRDALSKERSQVERRQSRLRDVEQARELPEQAVQADPAQLQSIYDRTRGFAQKYPEEPELQSIAREVERIVQARGDAAPAQPKVPTPKPKVPTPRPKSASAGRTGSALAPLSSLLSARNILIAAGVVGLVVMALVARHFWPTKPKLEATTATVKVHTVPPGAALRVNGEDRGTSDAELQLNAGDYRLEASLAGYATAQTTFSARAGASTSLVLTLQPSPEVLRIATPDLDGGQVLLDDARVGDLEGGALSLPNIPAGSHVLRIVARQSGVDATIQFQATPGAMPAVTSAPVTHQLQAVVVSSVAGSARVMSSVAGAAVSVDAKPSGQIGADGLQLTGLSAGVHELTLGEGNNARKMSFEVGPSPALDTIVYSDRDVGSILVQTSEDNADVFLDGKPYSRKTLHGQVRLPNLQTSQHTVRIHKDGFKDVPEQKVTIVKGQEARLTFTLEPLRRMATLSLDHIPPGAQVSLDDTPIGVVGADGTLTHGNIPPGQHTLSFAIPGYQPKRLQQNFSDGEAVKLSSSNLDLKHAQAVLEVVVAPNTQVTVEQGGHTVQQFTGSSKVPLDEGTYTVVARAPKASPTSANVTLAAGESKSLNFKTTTNGMEHWEQPWNLQDGWYTRHGGGFVLYDAPPGPGNYVFTLKLHHGHSFFSGSARIRWVVSYLNPSNYTEIQLDDKYLYRTEIVNGNKVEMPKVQHKIPDNSPFVTISVELQPSTLIQRFSVRPNEWKMLDSWDRTNAPSLRAKPRSFTDGKFGFLIPSDRDLEVSNFAFYPKR